MSPGPVATSIRRRLLRGVVVALGASGVVVFGALFAIGWAERRAAFEQALQDDLRTIANITQVFPGDDTYVNVEPESQGEYMAGGRRFFQVWDARTGELLDRSESLVALDETLPRPAAVGPHPARFDASLRDGRAVSFVTWRTDANWGLDAETLQRLHLEIRDQPVELLVGRTREELGASIAPLAGACLGGALLLPLLAVLILARLVPASLAPLARLGDELSARGSEDLRPLPPSPVEELAPVVQKLNELMARIEAARRRERGFIANASHELRTPLAELRALIDVAALEAEAPAVAPTPLPIEDLREVAQRMGELLDAFFRLAREGRAIDAAGASATDLVDVVRRALAAQRDAAAQRGLRWHVTGDEAPLTVTAPPTLLRALVDNLVANAVAHAPAGTEVRIDLQVAAAYGDGDGDVDRRTVRLRIGNDCAREPAGAHRAPPNDEHLGHGLVVARLYAQALGVRLATVRHGAGHVAEVCW